MKKYLLFIFAAHKDQDKFVKTISEEVVEFSDCSEVRYFYGPESAIITFKSDDSIDYLKSLVELVLDTSSIVYFFLPFIPENTSYFLTQDIEKHLFGTEKMTENEEKSQYEQIQTQNLFFDELAEITTNFTEEIMDDEDEDDLIACLKEKTQKPTLNDLLDKINSEGMENLTDEELNLLKTYSK